MSNHLPGYFSLKNFVSDKGEQLIKSNLYQKNTQDKTYSKMNIGNKLARNDPSRF